MADPVPPVPPADGLNVEAAARKFADDLMKQIKEGFEDIQAIVVWTAAANTDAQIDFNMKKGDPDTDKLKTKITAMASTRIEVDGDVSYMIPAETTEPRIRQEVITLHKENIALAMENSKKLLDTVLTMIEIMGEIAGLNLPDFRKRLMDAQNHSVIVPPVPPVPPVPSVPQ